MFGYKFDLHFEVHNKNLSEIWSQKMSNSWGTGATHNEALTQVEGIDEQVGDDNNTTRQHDDNASK